MSKGHKDLPTGSQPWAQEVDQAMAKVQELEAVIRRLTENAGIDMSNPKRGVNTGNTPSIKNPVPQKISSLADVSTYNVLDGQVLAWSQRDQCWGPITPVWGTVSVLPADTWSPPNVWKNLITDPSFELSTGGWIVDQDDNNSYVRIDYSIVPGAGRNGGNAMKMVFYYDNDNFPSSWVRGGWYTFPGNGRTFAAWIKTPVAGLGIDLGIDDVDQSTIGTYSSHTMVADEWTQFAAYGFGGSTGTDLTIAVNPVPANSAGGVTIYVDDAFLGDRPLYTGDFFNGDTPDDDDFVYAWEGAVNASVSTRTERRRIKLPAVIQASTKPQTIQVMGEGWAPGELIHLGMDDVAIQDVTAGADGTFDTGLVLPSIAVETWQHYIFAESDTSTTYISNYVTTV